MSSGEPYRCALHFSVRRHCSRLAHQSELLQNFRHILHVQGTLYNESLLLVEALREPRNCFSIPHAIAAGHTRLNEIAQAAGVGGRIEHSG